MPRRFRLPLLATALALGACSGEPADAPDYGVRRPVVLISIDSLRADRTTPYGHRSETAPGEQTTPFLDQMAREGTLFEQASAASPWTLPSHVTLLTGMHPREHGVRSRRERISDRLELVSGAFSRAGYRTAGFYSGPFLHNVWGFGHGFDVYQPGVAYLADPEAGARLANARKAGEMEDLHDRSHADAECAEQVVGKALDWLERDERWREPFFLFLHLWDPHYDYGAPAEYRRRFLPADDGSTRGDELMDLDVELTPQLKRELLALYDAEIRYTDDWIARLFARLEQWGIADDVIFVVTADHGDEFLEHGNRGHHLTLYEEVVRVPLLIRAPGLAPAGRRIGASVSLTDVAPTLLDLTGVGAWGDRSGASLRPLLDGAGGDRPVRLDLLNRAQDIQLIGWREGPMKLIYDQPRALSSVFDLAADPGELAASVFEGLTAGDGFRRRALESLRAEPRELPYPPGGVAEPEHVAAALEQAGYVGD